MYSHSIIATTEAAVSKLVMNNEFMDGAVAVTLVNKLVLLTHQAILVARIKL